MKKRLTPFLVTLAVTALVVFAARQGLWSLYAVEHLDQEIAPFELLTPDGGRVTSASLEGKVVVLDFWATWCGPCRKSFPNLQKVYENYEGRDDVAFLAVNTSWNDDLDDVRAFQDSTGYTLPFAFDEGSRLTDRIVRPNGIPTYCILDKNGRLRVRHVGYAPLFEDYGKSVQKHVEELL